MSFERELPEVSFSGEEMNGLTVADQRALRALAAYLSEYPMKAREVAIEQRLAFLLVRARLEKMRRAIQESGFTSLERWNLEHGYPIRRGAR